MPKGDKIATAVFWVVAGCLTIFLLVSVVGDQFYSFSVWEVAAGLCGLICLYLGFRQAIRAIRRPTSKAG
jgi:cadmium resistance protein CadD (predicted permease)